MFSVVKATRSPQGVIPPISGVKILIVTTIKAAQSFFLVIHRMRMDNIHNHPDPHTMSSVNQGFQLIRCPETGTHGKEIRHLITERTIIRMFLHGHQLYGVITKINNTR